MVEILKWFEEVIEKWKKIISLNKKIINQEKILDENRKIFFPIIPIELDCRTSFNIFSQFFPKLFGENGDCLILILNDGRDEILWSAVQHEENGNYVDFLRFEFEEQVDALELIRTNSIKKVNDYIKQKVEGLHSRFDLNFVIILDVKFLEGYEDVYEMMKTGFLDHVSGLWNFLARMLEENRIEIYNEPLFFNFLRKFVTDNKNFDAMEFKNIISKLLPPQNVIFSLFDDATDSTISFAILTTPYKFVFTFLEPDGIQQKFEIVKRKTPSSENLMAGFARQLHKKYRIFYNDKYLKVGAAFVMKCEIIDYFKNVIEKYDFKNAMVKFAEYIKNTDKLWTSDGKIVLFRRWGNTFLDFDVNKLNPSLISSFNKGIRFIHGYKTRSLIFIFDQDVNLLHVLGFDLVNGSFEKFYTIPKNRVLDIFKAEKDVEKAMLKAKHALSEELGWWINAVIGVRYTDLNKFSVFLSLGTSVGGALKFLKMLDNFFKYEMLMMPINPLMDVIKKEGTIKTLKKLYFPMVLLD